jgi:hypothetical protein
MSNYYYFKTKQQKLALPELRHSKENAFTTHELMDAAICKSIPNHSDWWINNRDKLCR